MNWTEAVEQMKQGKAVQRPCWGDAAISTVQLENGEYQIFASGELKPEMLVLMAGDFVVKDEVR